MTPAFNHLMMSLITRLSAMRCSRNRIILFANATAATFRPRRCSMASAQRLRPSVRLHA